MNATVHLPTRRIAELRIPIADKPPRRLWRATGHLPAAFRDPESIANAVRTAAAADVAAVVLVDPQPFARADLGEITARLAAPESWELALNCTGTGLTPALARQLYAAGMQRLILPLHAARADAHDWLVGDPGALRMVVRSIRHALAAELAVTAEVVVVRPTATLLPETIDLLGRLGVRSVLIRRLTRAHVEADPDGFVALSARLAALSPHLEQGVESALRYRMQVRLRDFPGCVAPRLRTYFDPPGVERWGLPDTSLPAPASGATGCPDCPELPSCGGAPADYTARFGWQEFAPTPAHASAPRLSHRPAATGLVFRWRGPVRIQCPRCRAGDADSDTGAESSRSIRAQLVQAARMQPACVRLVGGDLLAHVDAASLIFDAVRLFPHVEIAAEAGHLHEWSELDLRRLTAVKRLDFILFGPNAAAHDGHAGILGSFAATLKAVARLREETRLSVGAYAILHDATAVAEYAQAWAAGILPGSPQFRLAPDGGDLESLAREVAGLEHAPTRSALLALLPVALRPGVARTDAATASVVGNWLDWWPSGPVAHEPRAMELVGRFQPCQMHPGGCAAADCPGHAEGWSIRERSQTWLATI